VPWTAKGYYLGFQLVVFQVMTGVISYMTQAGHVMTVTLGQPIFGLYTPFLVILSQLVGTLLSKQMIKHM
jgi:uncharacterized membrane protein